MTNTNSTGTLMAQSNGTARNRHRNSFSTIAEKGREPPNVHPPPRPIDLSRLEAQLKFCPRYWALRRPANALPARTTQSPSIVSDANPAKGFCSMACCNVRALRPGGSHCCTWFAVFSNGAYLAIASRKRAACSFWLFESSYRFCFHTELTTSRLTISTMNTAPRISLAFRCASQRSIQAKTARTNRMLKIANTDRHSAAHKYKSGRAMTIPSQTPKQQSTPRSEERRVRQEIKYSRKYDPKRTGKRSRIPRSDCSWNEATAIGNISQRKLITQNRIGKYCHDARDANE